MVWVGLWSRGSDRVRPPPVPRVRVGSALFGPLHLGAMTHMLILICTLTSKTAGTAGVRILASLPVAGNLYTGKSALVGTRSAALDVLRMMLGLVDYLRWHPFPTPAITGRAVELVLVLDSRACRRRMWLHKFVYLG